MTDDASGGIEPDLKQLILENERLKAARAGLLAANARLVARDAGTDPLALVRATYGGSPTLTLRAFARFQGLYCEQDARLLTEMFARMGG